MLSLIVNRLNAPEYLLSVIYLYGNEGDINLTLIITVSDISDSYKTFSLKNHIPVSD